MMSLWKPQMIRFMNDASENSHYHRDLAKMICRYLPTDAHVCDAGCGLGHLSLELAEYCRQISAVDIAPQALGVLKKKLASPHYANISVIEGDINEKSPGKRFDAMVFCLFESTYEALKAAKAQCSGKVIIIKKNMEAHRFSLGNKPLEHDTLVKAQAYLHRLDIRFKYETFALEMGQPLRSIEDAVLFFRTYSRDDEPESITEKDIIGRIIRRPCEEFPYYVPSLNRLGMIVLDAGDIPGDIESF